MLRPLMVVFSSVILAMRRSCNSLVGFIINKVTASKHRSVQLSTSRNL